MAMRPLDRLPSVRAKLGSVIVFAVAVTILIMYVAIGFALRKSDRDREFRAAVAEAKGLQAFAFGATGNPIPSPRLQRQVVNAPNRVLLVDDTDHVLAGDRRLLALQTSSVPHLLSGRSSFDSGKIGTLEYVGIPVSRDKRVVGAVYVAYHVGGSGFGDAVSGTVRFVASEWWQFLVAGAVAASIALFLARILARGLTQPLRDMANAARRMARGEYGQRVRVGSRDEVGQLAVAFNRMSGEMAGLERLRRDLVANVSHELKTPISALRAHLENLLDGVEEPNPEVLAVMLQQSERLSRLIEQLLDLSRMDAGDAPLEVEPITLAPLIGRVVAEVAMARAGAGIDLTREVPDTLVPVHADRERLHQVLFNLLDNAVRFTQRGGHVRVVAAQRDGSCEVSVEDDGPGIPQSELELVFERFYRVDPSRSRDDGGTGIGLAIARSIVEAHGGRIWAENRPGRGARFTFSLPARSSVPPPPVVSGARIPTPTSSGGKGRRPELTGVVPRSAAPPAQEAR
jgi:signal transduction histidine kinase